MIRKIDWLYKMYRSHKRPCFCFDRDWKILWVNDAVMRDFPNVAEGLGVMECFPQFSLSCLSLTDSTVVSVPISNKLDGHDQLEVLIFPDSKESPLYVGVYYECCPVKLTHNANEWGSIKLFSYYIRQRMTSIFNHLELISEKLTGQGDYESLQYMQEVERNCQSLLKLPYNFNAYYAVCDENFIYKTEVDFHKYFIPIMEKVKTTLLPSNMSFEFEPDYQNGKVKLDQTLFSIAILNIINIACLYAQKGGSITCRTEFFPGQMILTLEDTVTDYEAVMPSEISDVVSLDITGEPSAMKKMCYDILQKTVQLHGGQCVITDNQPGVKIVIQMEATAVECDGELNDKNTYTIGRKNSGKLGIVDIMLSDVTINKNQVE